jgi:hypothetical protein
MRNGTDGVKMRNGTDGVKMRIISVPFRILTPYPFRILTPSVPFRILTSSVPFRIRSVPLPHFNLTPSKHDSCAKNSLRLFNVTRHMSSETFQFPTVNAGY